MIIKNIELKNFRNYSDVKFDLSPNTNVIFGDNAQGKTNFLEAVYYLTGVKSFRGVKDRDLVKLGEEAAEIYSEIISPQLEYSIGARLFVSGRRKLEINGIKEASAAELSNRIKAVLFSPDDLALIKDGAAERRKFMDMAFCQLRPKYAQSLSKYKRLQEHKTRILRDWRDNPSLLDTLPTFNLQMAETGAVIISYRAMFLRRMTAFAEEIHNEISGGREKLSLAYKTVSTIKDPLAPIPELKNEILKHCESHREAEIASGSVLSGPHKDDLEIYIDGNPAKTFASQGQSRTVALSLKLAERELFFADSGEYPILLLDDVLSELDNTRRDFVLNRISSGQVIITLCDDRELNEYGGKKFYISGGEIIV